MDNGRNGESAEQRRRRQQLLLQQQEQEIQGESVGAVLGGLAAVTLGCYAAYKAYNALTSSGDPRSQPTSPLEKEGAGALPPSTSISRLSSGSSCLQVYVAEEERISASFSHPWYHPRAAIQRVLNLFWKDVQEIQDIQSESNEILAVVECEARFRNKYNKFDSWFQNLNRSIIRFKDEDTKSFQEGFTEVCTRLIVGEMQDSDRLFKFLFRKMYPAGSSWENLRISASDEYDVNIILAPVDISKDVEVVDFDPGHLGIRLLNGFSVTKDAVKKKFECAVSSESNYFSIVQQLNNWLDENCFIDRNKVLKWMEGVVRKALCKLESYRWTHLQNIETSKSGPAITLIVSMKNGKTFSIDLVPAFEFTHQYLPGKTKRKIEQIRINNIPNWFAVPKGPRKNSPSHLWRTSLYELERNMIRGKDHLKPSIRFMKRLRDVEGWKKVSSYYLKTMFMQMEDRDSWSCGLGQLVMLAMRSLEKCLRSRRIDYYWDDGLNLLEDAAQEEFCRNVANRLSFIISRFERCADGEDFVYHPMQFFGCDRYGQCRT